MYGDLRLPTTADEANAEIPFDTDNIRIMENHAAGFSLNILDITSS